jgi:hypothetical protein
VKVCKETSPILQRTVDAHDVEMSRIWNRQERVGYHLPDLIHENLGRLGSGCVCQCVRPGCARSGLDG